MAKANEQQAAPSAPPTAVERMRAAAGELTRPRRRYVYLEFYDRKSKRRVRRRAPAGRQSLVRGLIADVELDDDTAPRLITGNAGASSGFGSRPPGHYAPRELLAHLERDLIIWTDWAGVEGRHGVEARVLALSGLARHLEEWGVIGEVTRDLEQWGDRLRRYAGLDVTFTPRASCPRCGKVGALTVWIAEDTERPTRGACGACGSRWDAATVGLLVEHVRVERGGVAPKVSLIKAAAAPTNQEAP